MKHPAFANSMFVGWLMLTSSSSISVVMAREVRTTGSESRVLPMWQAPWEHDAPKSHHRALQQQGTSSTDDPLPSTANIRLPAEYEPVASVVLSSMHFQQETLEIATHLLNSTDVDIFMAGGLDVELFDELSTTSSGSRYQELPFLSESVWTRDFGPVGVLMTDNNTTTQEDDESLALINMRYRHFVTRPFDNALPCHIGSLFEDWTCYVMELIVDGGNLMADGHGNLFTTTRTYDWNPELPPEQVDDMLKEYFGAHTIHALDYAKDEDGQPMDGTGHIDMFAKLLGDCKVVVAETESDVFDQITQAAADYFGALPCLDSPTSNYYEVSRVKGWYRVEEIVDEEWGNYTRSTWYTYTNSLIVNDVIIMPSYEDGGGMEDDAAAMAVYQAANPGRTILTVNMDTPIHSGGAVHCMTRQLPVAAANSPSQLELAIPNVTCSDVTMETCDVTKSSNPYCQEHYTDLQFSFTESHCNLNEIFYQHMCCADASERTSVLPINTDDDQETNTVLITLRLDMEPEETAWFLYDSNLDLVAASPYYGPEYANATLEIPLNLTAGVYTFVMLDADADGIDGDKEQWVDNLSNGDYLVTIDSPFERFASNVFVIPEPTATDDETMMMTDDESDNATAAETLGGDNNTLDLDGNTTTTVAKTAPTEEGAESDGGGSIEVATETELPSSIAALLPNFQQCCYCTAILVSCLVLEL